ncbi:tyrosine-type recombinase/integrase [Acinetobacter populi]|uniref:Integrase n=1 Tax=Acinetobacter populi TaxID=1582270 RepID=A0A1Z9YZN8_9GAMM|nr:site-specific integrase [Acinetobacter populi]OUY07632.1 integrase [Acinetobacter populi]
MQKPVKRGNAWRITVRYNGQRHTATRDTAQECEQWAAKKLLELQSSPQSEEKPKIHISFHSLLDQYYNEVGKTMKSAKFIAQQLKSLRKTWGPIADDSIHDLTPVKVKQWRDKRLKTVKPGTVIRQMGLYSSVFDHARKELFLTKENPFKEISKPPAPPARNQRISTEDELKILKGLDYEWGKIPTQPRHYVAWAFLFALETAMRKSEILSIHNEHIFADFVKLKETKNGTSRDVPLTARAKELIALLPSDVSDTRMVPHSYNSFRLLWERNLRRVGLARTIHFHDTRHEAITRFVHQYKLPVEILAKITGHKTISILVNTYYNPTASEIAKMLEVA